MFGLIEFGFDSISIRVEFGLTSGELSLGRVQFWISLSLGRVKLTQIGLGTGWVKVGFGYGFGSMLGRVEIGSG